MVSSVYDTAMIHVGCAIILNRNPQDKNQGKILIAQRKPGTHLGGYWEFPGGKCEDGETMQACLEREVNEELGIAIRPQKFLCSRQHAYPDRTVVLYFYLCEWVSGRPAKHDCQDFRWTAPTNLQQFRFPPADTEIIQQLMLMKF